MNTTPTLSPLLTRFVAAMNAHDSGAVAACFTPDAVVEDEGHTYRGTEAIQGWIKGAFEKYRLQMEVMDLANEDDGMLLSGQVSGTFPGSPALLKYRIVMAGDLMGALSISV